MKERAEEKLRTGGKQRKKQSGSEKKSSPTSMLLTFFAVVSDIGKGSQKHECWPSREYRPDVCEKLQIAINRVARGCVCVCSSIADLEQVIEDRYYMSCTCYHHHRVCLGSRPHLNRNRAHCEHTSYVHQRCQSRDEHHHCSERDIFSKPARQMTDAAEPEEADFDADNDDEEVLVLTEQVEDKIGRAHV